MTLWNEREQWSSKQVGEAVWVMEMRMDESQFLCNTGRSIIFPFS